MRVMFINTVFGRGSTGRIVEELGKAIESQGGEYLIVYGRGEKSDNTHVWRMESKLGNIIHAGVSRLTDRAGFYSKFATLRLVKKIRTFNPEVIHLHNLHGYYLNIDILFKYLKEEYSGQVVWTLHDCWAFTGHCTYYTYAQCNKWKVQCEKCVEKRKYPSSILLDSSEKNYLQKREIFTNVPNMHIITVSKWLQQQVEQSFLKEYPISCIYNGIDLDKFKPTESDTKKQLEIQDKKMILLVSDGWDERKGYSKFIEVTKIAPEDWVFVIVGISGKEKLPENVIGFERIWNQKELIQLYSAADVFFNPSVEETFGLVTVEAMACGTPVVVMNSTASPELVCMGGGSVCELSDSPFAIRDKISKIMGTCNVEKYAAQFSKPKNINRILNIYQKR